MRFSFLFFLILFFQSSGQVTIDVSQDLASVIKRLEGSGVHISNISLGANPNAAGYFFDEISSIGLEKGLILTSGDARNAVGPNDQPGKTTLQYLKNQDPDLLTLVDTVEEGVMADVCYVEFDIQTVYPTLEFSYVFASEEYLEYLEYHDVFGFFISGPGIIGKKNLAVIPGTTVPVSVRTISPYTGYNNYFRDNGSGTTPYLNPDFQYDGYTTILKASTNVIPCQTYHIKLAIADMLDDTYDAAVFIQEGGFVSNSLDINVKYEHERFKQGIEDCNNATLEFTRLTSNTEDRLAYKIEVKGTAIPGLDYNTIADSVVFSPGQKKVSVPLTILEDGIDDDNEFIRIVIKTSCASLEEADSIDVPVREYFPHEMPDVSICENQSALLNADPIASDTVLWNASVYLSCLHCLSPVATPPDLQIVYFPFLAHDTVTGCFSFDSVAVTTVVPKASFEFRTEPCYTSLDYFFENKSSSFAHSSWDFGDGSSSDEQNPSHMFPGVNTLSAAQYLVTLIVESEGPSCKDDTTVLVSINQPFLIPNLITVNGDNRNDKMVINGMESGCWKFDLYNEWGNLVFTQNEYDHNFSGEGLTAGVYYYLLSNHPGDRQYKGWIHLLK